MALDILRFLGIRVSDIQRNSESEIEHKIVMPYLQRALGYTDENGAAIRLRVSKTIQVGSSSRRFLPDIAVYVDREPFLMIDCKPINKGIEEGDVNEAVSNARLYEFPKQFPLSIVTTGLKWEVYDSITRNFRGDYSSIPNVKEAKLLIQHGLAPVSDSKKKEAERFLATRILIKDRQKLGSLFKECYTRIEAEGKKFHEALSEISKIILAKIYEEQYSVEEQRPYRFSREFLDQQLTAYPKKDATQILTEIFQEANKKYKGDRPEGIFPESAAITLSPGTVKKIVELLQDYAFYGAGEDIKGAVYETFLKEIFRGERGQYFTPREIVRFIIQLTDPKPGEKIIDPAAGSGGFLIHCFLDVKKKILQLPLTQEEKEGKVNQLLGENLWGVDVTETLVQFCKINLLIHGDGYKNIYRSDALDKHGLLLKEVEGQFDLVVTNPPFDLPSEHLEHIINDYTVYKEHGYNGADVLYLERCYELLKPGGRLAIVVPHRFVDAKRFQDLRIWILSNTIPLAIITLPSGVFKPFGGSSARTAILYLRKPKDNDKRIEKVLMASVKQVGFETGVAEYEPIEENDLDNIAVSEQMFVLREEEDQTYG
jgi:type I restriction enzyme M protein